MTFQGLDSGNTAIYKSIMAPFLLDFSLRWVQTCDQSTRVLPDKCRCISFAELYSMHCKVPSCHCCCSSLHLRKAYGMHPVLKTSCTVTDLIPSQLMRFVLSHNLTDEEIKQQRDGVTYWGALACGRGSQHTGCRGTPLPSLLSLPALLEFLSWLLTVSVLRAASPPQRNLRCMLTTEKYCLQQ